MSSKELRFMIRHREAKHSVVQRTAHRFTGRYAVSVENEADQSLVCLAGDIEKPEELKREFLAAMLDDALRARIERDTSLLRQIIVEAALRSALRQPEAPL